jgi:hypothetical protein
VTLGRGAHRGLSAHTGEGENAGALTDGSRQASRRNPTAQQRNAVLADCVLAIALCHESWSCFPDDAPIRLTETVWRNSGRALHVVVRGLRAVKKPLDACNGM